MMRRRWVVAIVADSGKPALKILQALFERNDFDGFGVKGAAVRAEFLLEIGAGRVGGRS
jgi:hypothetical protein